MRSLAEWSNTSNQLSTYERKLNLKKTQNKIFSYKLKLQKLNLTHLLIKSFPLSPKLSNFIQ